MSWFGPKSPVSPEAAAWIGRSMDWCLAQFGRKALDGPVLVPEEAFFPYRYQGSFQDVEAILEKVCRRMGVDRQLIQPVLTPPDDKQILAQVLTGRSAGAAGHYQPIDDGYLVAISQTQLPDPVAVTAVIAHELGHVRLLGEGRIEPGRRDGEQLTDLVTVALGLGVFSANASFDFDQSASGWRVSRLGYLSEEMFGYALAWYARQRGERAPSWVEALDSNPRGFFRQAQRYLDAT
ncbi:MAG TPA: hypothetical protein VLL08_05575 [Kineosporiaceae bacterium]|nr:hypothetical protein [Kineosporiaceae bacterium]